MLFCCCVLGILYIFQLIVVKHVVGMSFVPVCTLYLHLLYRVFGRAKVLEVCWSSVYQFSLLWTVFLLSSPRTVYQPLYSEAFLIFFSESFMVLGFTFKFMSHCELIFVWSVFLRLRSFLCVPFLLGTSGAVQLLQHHWVRKATFHLLNCFCALVRKKMGIFKWVSFWFSILCHWSIVSASPAIYILDNSCSYI